MFKGKWLTWWNKEWNKWNDKRNMGGFIQTDGGKQNCKQEPYRAEL